jgi:hypothetical protein
MALGSPHDTQRMRKSLFPFPRPKAHEAMCRGSLFAPLPLFVTNHLGEHRWEEILSTIEPQASSVLRAEFQPLSWYPFGAISAAVDAIVNLPGLADGDTLRRLAYHNLDRATNLIFRAIFKMGSPEFMVSKSDQVWKKYYSTGSMHVPEASKGAAVVQLFDFPEITRNYNKVVLYGIEAVIAKAGGRLTRHEITRDIHRGDPYCEYSFVWT